jgi:hypothetical protein
VNTFPSNRPHICDLCNRPINPGDMIASLRMLAYGASRFAHADCVPQSIRDLPDWQCHGMTAPGSRGGGSRRCKRGTYRDELYCPTHRASA